jgi:hypothetical protein
MHRRLIALRRRYSALAVGSKQLLPAAEGVLVFERARGEERLLVALNLTHDAKHVEMGRGTGRILLSTHLDRSRESVQGVVALRADEGLLIELGQ